MWAFLVNLLFLPIHLDAQSVPLWLNPYKLDRVIDINFMDANHGRSNSIALKASSSNKQGVDLTASTKRRFTKKNRTKALKTPKRRILLNKDVSWNNPAAQKPTRVLIAHTIALINPTPIAQLQAKDEATKGKSVIIASDIVYYPQALTPEAIRGKVNSFFKLARKTLTQTFSPLNNIQEEEGQALTGDILAEVSDFESTHNPLLSTIISEEMDASTPEEELLLASVVTEPTSSNFPFNAHNKNATLDLYLTPTAPKRKDEEDEEDVTIPFGFDNVSKNFLALKELGTKEKNNIQQEQIIEKDLIHFEIEKSDAQIRNELFSQSQESEEEGAAALPAPKEHLLIQNVSVAKQEDFSDPSLLEKQLHSQEPVSDAPLGVAPKGEQDTRLLLLGNASIWAGVVLGTDVTTNVTYASTNPARDIILRPALWTRLYWPITEDHSLNFEGRLGYSKYVKNKSLDRRFLLISPNSELNFIFYVKDIRINIYDTVSYAEDPINANSVNNVASYRRITNALGAAINWQWRIMDFNLLAERTDFNPIDERFKDQAKVTNRIEFAPSYTVSDALRVGLRFARLEDKYERAFHNNSASTITGLNLWYRFGRYLSNHTFIGFENRTFDERGSIDDNQRKTKTVTFNSKFIHRLTPNINHSLTLSKNLEANTTSNFLNTYKADYLLSMLLNPKTTGELSGYYEILRESGLNNERATRYSVIANFKHTLSPRTGIGLQLRHVNKSSNQSSKSYKEYRVTLDLAYAF